MVYILTKGKRSINAEKNENVKLPHTQLFCGRLCLLCECCIGATDTCWYKMQTADRIQNIDCKLQSGYKMQTENLKSFYVWYIITTCHLAAYRASRNRFSAISLHDYLHYCGIFLAHFLMKIDRNIISSLQYSLLTLCASWLV